MYGQGGMALFRMLVFSGTELHWLATNPSPDMRLGMMCATNCGADPSYPLGEDGLRNGSTIET